MTRFFLISILFARISITWSLLQAYTNQEFATLEQYKGDVLHTQEQNTTPQSHDTSAQHNNNTISQELPLESLWDVSQMHKSEVCYLGILGCPLRSKWGPFIAPRQLRAIGLASKNLLESSFRWAHRTGLVHHRIKSYNGYSRILIEAFQVELTPTQSGPPPDRHVSPDRWN